MIRKYFFGDLYLLISGLVQETNSGLPTSTYSGRTGVTNASAGSNVGEGEATRNNAEVEVFLETKWEKTEKDKTKQSPRGISFVFSPVSEQHRKYVVKKKRMAPSLRVCKDEHVLLRYVCLEPIRSIVQQEYIVMAGRYPRARRIRM